MLITLNILEGFEYLLSQKQKKKSLGNVFVTMFSSLYMMFAERRYHHLDVNQCVYLYEYHHSKHSQLL